MRTRVFLLLSLFIYLLGTSGCVQCECCSAYGFGNVKCTKDSLSINLIILPDGPYAQVKAATQDTFNYYTAQGYTCSQSVTPSNLELGKLCGLVRIKQAERGGDGCTTYSNLCEP